MPLYAVQTVFQLAPQEQDKLAEEITVLHSSKFNTPRHFVNVIFTPVPGIQYVGGKRSKSNTIAAVVRTGPSRTKADFDDLSAQLTRIWTSVVNKPDGDRALRIVTVIGGLQSVREDGFLIPLAGGERPWIRQNLATFQQRANAGEQAYQDMLKELQHTPEFKDLMVNA